MIRIYYDHVDWHAFTQRIVSQPTCYKLETTQTLEQFVKAAIKAGGVMIGTDFIPWHRVYRVCEA